MFKLLIPATLALLTAGLGPSEVLARGGCLAADDYLRDGADASNRQMASAIACLTGSLGPAGSPSTADDREVAEKIIRLANMVIGNGARAAAQNTIGTGVRPASASLAGSADTAIPQRSASRSDVIQAAGTIICVLSSRYLADRQIEASLLANKGTCPADGDAKEQILQAGKIIGNG